jgi:hypothetical protein
VKTLAERLVVRPAALAFGMLAVVAVEIIVTYWRIEPEQLYHVSDHGAGSGFGRALVYLNFPVALAALPLIGLAVDRLRHRRAAVITSIAAAALCAVVFWPGVVDQADLDAKPVNAACAVGVALAVALAAAAGVFALRARVVPLVAASVLLLIVIAIPWIAADLGFFLDGVPVLGRVFVTGKIFGGHPAVHHGHHHGMDGTLLALVALALVPLVRRIAVPWLRQLVCAYVGLMLAYGLANFANDAWAEQLWKRGWVDGKIPNVLHPAVSLAWLGILLAAGAFTLTIARPIADVRGARDCGSDQRPGVERGGARPPRPRG